MKPERRSTRGFSKASDMATAWIGSQELMRILRPHMAKVRWAEVVGPQVAAVTQVEAVREGVLVVRVKNTVWANELALLREDIVRRLNSALGGHVIKDIRFKGGGLRHAPAQPAAPAPAVPTQEELALVLLSRQTLERIENTVQSAPDPLLRERLRASLLRVSRIEQWKRSQGWHPCMWCAALIAPPSVVCEPCRVQYGPYRGDKKP